MFNKLLEPTEFAGHLQHSSVLIIDLCRQDTYQQTHLPAAIHIPPAALVTGEPPATGRLPSQARLQTLADNIGLTPQHHVVIYDDEGGGWSGRFAWTLQIMGHEKWSVLDGGLIAWSDAGLPLTDHVTAPAPTHCELTLDLSHRATRQDILDSLGQDHAPQIWDARSPEEFAGLRNTARRNGHIPGAINLEWTQLMDPARSLRLRTDAKERLAQAGIDTDKPVITHCQTHHRSGFTWLAGHLLGLDIRGYDGSWSEWGNLEDSPIET